MTKPPRPSGRAAADSAADTAAGSVDAAAAREDGPLSAALLAEAAKKSALVWVRGPQGPARALWHVWYEDAVCLVGGPGEQPLDDLGLADGSTATVTLRSKDKGGRLLVWPVRVSEVTPGQERWEATVGELRGKRLNAPDSEHLADRWARECRVLRLVPEDEPIERPGAMPEARPAPPLPTPATTRRPVPAGLPKLLLRRKGRR